MKSYYVYIMSYRHHGTLYTGMTNDLERRVSEHKLSATPGFATKYHVEHLVYFEDTTDVLAAIAREKHLKGWTRAKKVALIECENPHWDDLSESWWQPNSLPKSTSPPNPSRALPPPDPQIPSRTITSQPKDGVGAQNDR